MEFKYEIGENVWVYGRDGYEQAEIIERYTKKYGHRVYYVHAESFKGCVHENFIRK